MCRDAFATFLAQHADYFGDGVDLGGSASDVLRSILARVSQSDCPAVYLIIDEYDNFANQLVSTRKEDLYEKLTTT